MIKIVSDPALSLLCVCMCVRVRVCASVCVSLSLSVSTSYRDWQGYYVDEQAKNYHVETSSVSVSLIRYILSFHVLERVLQHSFLPYLLFFRKKIFHGEYIPTKDDFKVGRYNKL